MILEHHGWDDPSNTESRLDQGENVKPEGYRSTKNSCLTLLARFHAPVNMISLSLIDILSREKVQFHFLYTEKPELIIEWIVKVADQLDLENYSEIVKKSQVHCDMILLEISESEIYEVRPSARA
ncbi:MAG: hypothetical protein MRZ79_03490 [Bacteroidia bacterium]|nr:hypothetical protein [Bacteroidia bacterium]